MAADPEATVVEISGELDGHTDWVTSIATATSDQNTIVTASRDKSIVIWELSSNTGVGTKSVTMSGKMVRRLTGHNHTVSSVVVSNDKQYVLSGSWDKSLRLWDFKSGRCKQRFVGHTGDVMSVAFSKDNKHIVSGGRDKSVKVWNGNGKEQQDLSEHTDWVTSVKFSPNPEERVIVSSSRDGSVKVWEMNNFKLLHNLTGHDSYVNAVTVSPDGSLCASGGKGGMAMLWDLNEGKPLSTLDAGGPIKALCFSPNRYWLCGALGGTIQIWDLESKESVGTLDYKLLNEENEKDGNEKPAKRKRKATLDIECTCLAWSADGNTLFAGYTDGIVRMWSLITPPNES